MTREEIETEFDVVNGVIRSPGKFESEAVYAPYFYEISLDGTGEELSFMQDGCGEYVCLVEIDESDAEIFDNEAEANSKYALLIENDQGFVSCKLITTEAEADKIREAYELCDDEQEDES
jgi:hypothetical protein